jgi:hypothetical protein
VQTVRDFLKDVDRGWRGGPEGKIRLNIIGSVALLLQSNYERGTKDSDVLQTAQLSDDTKRRLIELAGEKTLIHQRHHLYLDVVANGIPFLPHGPLYHAMLDLNASLAHFEIHVLDVVDVVVSKLKPFRGSDRDDIRAMIARGLVPHDRLVARFRDAVDDYFADARAEEGLPRYVGNLHVVERDDFDVDETEIELPSWIVDR